MRKVSLETITGTLSWYKILPLSGFNLIRAKQKSAHETEKKLIQNSWNRRKHQKLWKRTTRWNLGKHVRFCHGITELQHLIDPRQMAWLKEPSDEWRKVRQQYCYSQDWMKRWKSDSIECRGNLRNVQDLQADGKTPCERRFGEPLKGPIITFGALVDFHAVFTARSVKNSSIWQESTTWNLSWLWADRRENLERRCLLCRPGRFWNVGCIWCLPSKNQSKGSIWSVRKDDEFVFPNSRWHTKTVRKRLQIPSTHSKAGTTCKEWKSQWRHSRRIGRVSTGRTCEACGDFLVASRWHHLSPSHWTTSTTLCRKKKRSLFQ